MTAAEAVVNKEYVHKYSKNRYVFLSKRNESHGNFFCMKEKKSYPLAYSLMTRCV